MRAHLLTPLLFAVSCATASPAPSGEVERDAAAFEAHGLELSRPEGWSFAAPDATASKDAVVLMIGPQTEAAVAPMIEVHLRELGIDAQRRKPMHIIAALTTEIVQTYAVDGGPPPEELEVAGLPAGLIRIQLTEMLGDGTEIPRQARFYGVVNADQLWVIKCLGPDDGSAEPVFDQLIASMTIARR